MNQNESISGFGKLKSKKKEGHVEESDWSVLFVNSAAFPWDFLLKLNGSCGFRGLHVVKDTKKLGKDFIYFHIITLFKTKLFTEMHTFYTFIVARLQHWSIIAQEPDDTADWVRVCVVIHDVWMKDDDSLCEAHHR